MSKKTVQIVTDLAPRDGSKDVSTLERNLKDLYRKNTDSSCCVTFSHKTSPFAVADTAKQKKNDAIIFHTGVPLGHVASVVEATKRRYKNPDDLPLIIHITHEHSVMGTVIASDHEAAYGMVFAVTKN